jgi:hypothetical protein
MFIFRLCHSCTFVAPNRQLKRAKLPGNHKHLRLPFFQRKCDRLRSADHSICTADGGSYASWRTKRLIGGEHLHIAQHGLPGPLTPGEWVTLSAKFWVNSTST